MKKKTVNLNHLAASVHHSLIPTAFREDIKILVHISRLTPKGQEVARRFGIKNPNISQTDCEKYLPYSEKIYQRLTARQYAVALSAIAAALNDHLPEIVEIKQVAVNFSDLKSE